MNSKTIVGIIVTVLVVAGIVFFVLSSNKGTQPAGPTQENTGLGADLYEKAAPNPGTNIPTANPFEKSANPLEGAYKNPFGQ